jgi:hypothetical protein
MAQSVSNDALWEKLSEIDGKVVEALTAKKALDPEQNRQVEITAASKEEIIETIQKEIRKYGQSNESYLETNEKNIKMLNHNILAVKKDVGDIKLPESQNLDEIKTLLEKKDMFRFGVIQFRKTSFIITILGILIFTLTIFCMKLYSDSLIYQNNYYRQIIATRKIQVENDSLKVKVLLPRPNKKKKSK